MQGDPGVTVSPAIATSKLSHSSGLEQNFFHPLLFFALLTS